MQARFIRKIRNSGALNTEVSVGGALSKLSHAASAKISGPLGVLHYLPYGICVAFMRRPPHPLTSASASLFSRSSRSCLCVSVRASDSLASSSSFFIFPCGFVSGKHHIPAVLTVCIAVGCGS